MLSAIGEQYIRWPRLLYCVTGFGVVWWCANSLATKRRGRRCKYSDKQEGWGRVRNGYVMQPPRDVYLRTTYILQYGRGNIICLRDLFTIGHLLTDHVVGWPQGSANSRSWWASVLDPSHKQGPMRYVHTHIDVPTSRSSRSSKDGGISNQFKSPRDVTPTLLYGNGGRLCWANTPRATLLKYRSMMGYTRGKRGGKEKKERRRKK